MKLLFVYINMEQLKKKRERETVTLEFDDYHNFDFHDYGEDQDDTIFIYDHFSVDQEE